MKYDYRHGDYHAICDICGFQFHASKMKMTWDNLFVCKKDFDHRHPQDFVRGRAYNQRVPIPRPGSDAFTDTQTALTVAASPGDSVLNVDSVVNVSVGDSIVIILDNHQVHQTTVSAVSSTISLTNPMPSSAAVGNSVTTLTNTVSGASL